MVDLWLPLALSGLLLLFLALSGSLSLSLAPSGSLWLAWLTRPLLSLQQRCCAATLYAGLMLKNISPDMQASGILENQVTQR